jgi:hypothetical protein
MTNSKFLTALKIMHNRKLVLPLVTKMKRSIEHDAGKWYGKVMTGKYDFISLVKEC